MKELALNLARIPIRVRVHGAISEEHLTARFGAFSEVEAPAPTEAPISLDLTVDESASERIPQPESVAWPGCSGHGVGAETIRFQRSGFEMTYNAKTRHAIAFAAPPNSGLAPVVDPTPIDTPLRLLLSYELPRRNGLLLHASGYGDHRGALIFAGASGAGKTTTARKLPSAGVLSDDQIAVRSTDRGWVAMALPFVGEYARPTAQLEAPLRRLFLLAHGTGLTYTRQRAPRPLALTRVLACAPWFVNNDPGSASLLALVGALIANVEVDHLVIGRDAPILPLIEDALS